MPPRIAADFNGISQSGQSCCLVLDSFGTLRELSYHRIQFQKGMKLVFWDQSDEVEDLEVETELDYEPYWKTWIGKFPTGAIQYVPAKDRMLNPFLCFSCRVDLTTKFPHFRSHVPMVCPECGLSLMTPMEPPTLAPSGTT